jgi:arylsulfatase A-like enzyme
MAAPASLRMTQVIWAAWLRIAIIGAAAGLFSVSMYILIEIDAWLLYQSIEQTVLEITHLVLVALGAAALGSFVLTMLAAALPTWSIQRTKQRAEMIRRGTAVAAAIFCSLVLWRTIFAWTAAVRILNFPFLPKYSLWLVLVALAFVLFGRRVRSSIDSFDAALESNISRRVVIGASLGAATVALADAASANLSITTSVPSRDSAGSPNIILVTFDALSADDMSLYGYRLPTTPHIDLFAQSASVFSNFFACSTWTTPCVASIQTGRYPVNTRVFQSLGRLQGQSAGKSLVRELRAAGYDTGASVANIYAYPPRLGLDFNLVLQLPIKGLISTPILQDDALSLQMRIGDVLQAQLPSIFDGPIGRYPPELSFEQADALLARLRAPFFLWIHVMAPHFPYKPSAAFLNRFLSRDQAANLRDIGQLFDRPGRRYSPAQQPAVDSWRLRYDEWVANADNAFGQFIGRLNRSGVARNTAVIISADHGESFEGGFWAHGQPEQVRPVIHVPFAVHLPGQTERRLVSNIADQTVIAPTILDLAGVPIPAWMDGTSVKKWLETEGEDASVGVAFTQFFNPGNSIFSDPTTGTMGVIANQHQYVLDVATGKGTLYRLAEANRRDNDISTQEPEVAKSMRSLILSRFPGVLRA